MAEESTLIVVLCTVPDEATAEKLARGLVEERLAACVNVIPGVRSFYRWKGALEVDAELQLLVKTHEGRFEALEAWLHENHPYDVPEVVAIPAARVSEAYGAWAAEVCDPPPDR